MAKKENTRTVEVVVSADLVELAAGDKRPDVAAYAFSAGGKLLDSRVLDAKGNAALKLPVSAQATSVRVLVGPRLPKEAGLDEVLRRGAQESHLRIDTNTARTAVGLTILRDDWLCWLRSACSACTSRRDSVTRALLRPAVRPRANWSGATRRRASPRGTARRLFPPRGRGT